MEFEWRKLLKTVADCLTKKNVNDIHLLYDIPDGIAENLRDNGIKTLKELENRDIINPNDPNSLHDVLNRINRLDLKKHVTKFKECFKDVLGGDTESATMNPKKDPSELRMSSSPRGICLIISNEKFDRPQNKNHSDSNKNRPGTLVDERSLEKTFKWLGFEVMTERNCRADQMYKKLESVAKQDHNGYDAFVCCILTHGTKGQVFGIDWKSLEIVKIRGLFEEHVCKGLAQKPKIFLIQACRGDDTDLGYPEQIPTETSEMISSPDENNQTIDELDGESGAEASNRTPDSTLDQESVTVKQQASDKNLHEDNGSADLKKASPSNFLFVFPSVQGHKSILDNEKGSWLISTICKVFQQHAYIAHLHSMLAEVNKQMGRFTSTLVLPYKSTAEIQDSLDHHYIYFQPSMTYEGYCKKFNQC